MQGLRIAGSLLFGCSWAAGRHPTCEVHILKSQPLFHCHSLVGFQLDGPLCFWPHGFSFSDAAWTRWLITYTSERRQLWVVLRKQHVPQSLSAKTVLVQKELQQMHVVARRLSAWLEVAMIAELLRHAYVNS